MKVSGDVEDVVQQTVKKAFLVFLGTGLIGNALYIYGLAYYEGYLEGVGLDALLFPIEWAEARLWTYFASRELGVSTVNVWVKFTWHIILIMMLVIYVIARLWVALNGASRLRRPRAVRIKRLRKIVLVGKRFPVSYKVIKWLVIREQAFFAFFASYFALMFMLFVPLFLLVWVLFPNIGLSHGESVGKKKLSYYERNLCGGEADYWEKCVSINSSFLQEKDLPEFVKGRIIIASEDLLGLITDMGPVTMTRPKLLYFLNKKNTCYEGGCDLSEAKIE